MVVGGGTSTRTHFERDFQVDFAEHWTCEGGKASQHVRQTRHLHQGLEHLIHTLTPSLERWTQTTRGSQLGVRSWLGMRANVAACSLSLRRGRWLYTMNMLSASKCIRHCANAEPCKGVDVLITKLWRQAGGGRNTRTQDETGRRHAASGL